MRTIIAGSRDFNDYALLKRIVEGVDWDITLVVSGTARGADKLGEQWAEETKTDLVRFPADWDKHGKRAGHIRNEDMAKNADACIVFWDGKSRGTANMISLAKRYKLQLKIVKYNDFKDSELISF